MRAEEKYSRRPSSNRIGRAIVLALFVIGCLVAFYLYDRQSTPSTLDTQMGGAGIAPAAAPSPTPPPTQPAGAAATNR